MTSRMSRGVRDLPGNLQSATSGIPSGKSLVYFGFLLAAGVFFIFIAFTLFLPVIVLLPQKISLCFTAGCAFIIGAFFALPKNQFILITSTERLPFTLGFIGSMVGTIYVSMVLHSYILSVFFAVIQIIEDLKEVLLGMKVGGKRRALIPHSVGYVNENLQPIPDEFGPRRSLLSYVNEPLIFEVQLLKVI